MTTGLRCALVAVSCVVAASCGAGSGSVDPAPAGPGGTQAVAPSFLDRDAITASSEVHLFVLSGGDEPAAALRDTSTGGWEATATPPFDGSLYGAGAVWTGSTYLVVGNRCTTYEDSGGAQPECEPGGIAASSYDPAADTWATVPSPVQGDGTVSISAVGAVGDEAFFRIGAELRAFDVGDGGWVSVPGAPFDPHEVCVVEGGLVAARVENESIATGPVDDGPRLPTPQPFRAARYDASTATWSAVEQSGGEDDAVAWFTVVCAPGGVLLVPSLSPSSDDGSPPALHRFADGRWDLLPGPDEDLGSGVASTVVGDAVAIWAERGLGVLDLADGEPWWSVRRGDFASVRPVEAIEPGHALVVEEGPDEESRVLVVSLDGGG